MAYFSLLCVMALPCTFAYSYCTMPIMPCPAFCPRPALLLLCPLLICPPALPCPAMSSPALSSTALSSPALPANSPISGRSDRKVLRLIYRYRHFGHFLTHFAALSVTDTKQMVTIWTSRFEDLSLNCNLG